MKTFIFLVGVKYDVIMKQRPHHMADYLASRGYKVLYIGIDSEKKVLEENEFHKLFTYKEELELFTEIRPNLFTIPFVVRNVNGIKKGMDDFLSKIELFYGSENTIFYVGHPIWMQHLGRLSRHTTIIYDCMDDWEEFVLDLGFGERLNIYDEKKLAGISDLVITSAKKLYCKMYNYNENIYYMPNGVRTQDYAMSYYVPKDLEKINKPIVFFMGTITGWVDLELIDYISKERPNYSFVYVGNIAEVKEKDIPRRDNIYYLGKKKYTELVNYLKQARVAIIPFKENKLTASVTPLKFFEYISAGVPVLTTMFPDLIGIKNVCIANNYSEFLDAIDKYIEMDEDEYRNLQQELFKTSIQFEWSNMLDKLIAYLENNENKEEFKKDFINNTIDYYEIFSDNTIIKNELLTMYNLVERYEDVIRIGEEIKNEVQKFDIEQLALASIKTGRLEDAINYLKLLIKSNERYSLYKKYISNLLKHKNSRELLEIFLLKACYRHYEAIALCESIINDGSMDSFVYLMLSNLYYEIGEYDISSGLFLTVLDNMGNVNIREFISPYHLINLIDYYIEKKAYDFAEELGLILIEMGLEDIGAEKLGNVYFAKYYPMD